METTRLSSKGQVIIPKALRERRKWASGLELVAVETAEGILLCPKTAFQAASLDEVAGSLQFTGKAKSDKDIDVAMRKAARRSWRDLD